MEHNPNNGGNTMFNAKLFESDDILGKDLINRMVEIDKKTQEAKEKRAEIIRDELYFQANYDLDGNRR